MKNITKSKKKQKEKQTNLVAPQKIKVLFTIIDRSKVESYLDLFASHEINMSTVFYARGTAPSNILELIGVNNTDKAIIMSFVRENLVSTILLLLEKRFEKVKNGKGIAFTVSMSSIIGITAYKFLSNQEG